MSPTTRRTVLMGAVVPLTGIPDFSARAPGYAAPDPDAGLVALCREHEQQWAIANANESTEDEADAAVQATTTLCNQIAHVGSQTALGLAWKARVAATESGLSQILARLDLYPPHLQDDAQKVLLSLLHDLFEMRALAS